VIGFRSVEGGTAPSERLDGQAISLAIVSMTRG